MVFGGGIEIIGEKCLAGLPNLEEVVLPKSLKEINTTMYYSSNIQRMKLPEDNPFFTNENGILIEKRRNRIIFLLSPEERVMIPEIIKELEIEYIRKGIKEIYIPTSIEKIGSWIYQIQQATFVVAPDHLRYSSTGNCVYEKGTGNLCLITVKDKTLEVAEGVKYIGVNGNWPVIVGCDTDFEIGFEPEKVIYPDSIIAVGSSWIGSMPSKGKIVYCGEKPKTILG